jgi:hypothetical protein
LDFKERIPNVLPHLPGEFPKVFPGRAHEIQTLYPNGACHKYTIFGIYVKAGIGYLILGLWVIKNPSLRLGG